MAVRSTMDNVPTEFYQKIEKSPRMIIVTESTLAECCSLSKNIGVVVDLGGYSQKKWDERMQKWTTEIVTPPFLEENPPLWQASPLKQR